MLHSGSRGIGNVIGALFHRAARKEMRAHQVRSAGPRPRVPPRGHAAFDEYVEAVGWAQDYATENRAK